MSNRRQQGGIALIAALFLIVVLAGLGVVASRLSSTQQQGISMRILLARARAAADSGIEFGIYQALNAGMCINTTLPLTQASLNNFTVAVTCSSHDHQLGSPTFQVYQLSASAEYGTYGQPDYVFRQVTRTVSNAP